MAEQMSITILDDYERVAESYADWASLGDVDLRAFHERIEDPDSLVEAIGASQIVILMRERTRIDAELLHRLPNLRLLVTSGMGNAAVDMVEAKRRGIPVCGTTGPRTSTSELTWALILALSRDIPRSDAALRAGRWEPRLGVELGGKTLGIIGLGKVGSKVARIGAAFGMEVVAWSRNLTQDVAGELGVTAVSKEELLRSSDVVTLHVQLARSTRGLIGGDEIRRMKSSAFLVNTSRGEVIDQDALVEALRTDVIAGAGLDTHEVEPLPSDSPLLSLRNTVLTPHLGYVSDRTYRAFYGQGLDDVRAWLEGEPIRVLNP